MKVLGVIPARGGSKGLPRKNVLALGGAPLIAWTIRAAREAKSLARVVVSTDDDEIANVAREYGAEVPFVRPFELATDSATSMAVVKHALIDMEAKSGETFDAVCLLQPTSPFRVGLDVDGAVAMLAASDAPSVISISPLEHPLAWTALVGESGELALPFLRGLFGAGSGESGAHSETQRQAHRVAYRLNGAVYVYRRAVVLEHATGLLAESKAYVMGDLDGDFANMTATIRGIDIDSAADLALANAIASGMKVLGPGRMSGDGQRQGR